MQHFYIGTKIKLDPGSELGSFDLGSGKMLVQPGIRHGRGGERGGDKHTACRFLSCILIPAEIWVALNNEILRADAGTMRREWNTAGMQGRGKREIPEKTHRPAASSGTILTYGNPGVAWPGIESSSLDGRLAHSAGWYPREGSRDLVASQRSRNLDPSQGSRDRSPPRDLGIWTPPRDPGIWSPPNACTRQDTCPSSFPERVSKWRRHVTASPPPPSGHPLPLSPLHDLMVSSLLRPRRRPVECRGWTAASCWATLHTLQQVFTTLSTVPANTARRMP
ncbi:hypothetical protein PR048_002334 [Dryococelus australis]|uniref:Uncharacterized protein n=1 Tax=Dryococelus australis TaxID=614101 RepID=A0ABQ9IJX5_9NEOP|nr:hypothetical protein PR048_002334 [Dryococelus australis]